MEIAFQYEPTTQREPDQFEQIYAQSRPHQPPRSSLDSTECSAEPPTPRITHEKTHVYIRTAMYIRMPGHISIS